MFHIEKGETFLRQLFSRDSKFAKSEVAHGLDDSCSLLVLQGHNEGVLAEGISDTQNVLVPFLQSSE
jgi:hypothetical protein